MFSKRQYSSTKRPRLENPVRLDYFSKIYLFIPKLSKILEKQPKVLNNKVLSCPQKSITSIDPLPYVFTTIETLLIPRNLLSSLQGLSQFLKLKILDVSHNQIKELDELFYLKELKNLEILTFEQNPVNLNPAFFDMVIALVPNLRVLNSRVFFQSKRIKNMLI